MGGNEIFQNYNDTMTSSSDDSLPLIRRHVARDIREKKNQSRKMLLGDSSESSLPSWMEDQNTAQQRDTGVVTSRAPGRDNKRNMIFIDSDSDSDDNTPIVRSSKRDEEEKPLPELETTTGGPNLDLPPSTVVLDDSMTQQPSQTTTTNKSKDHTLKNVVNSNNATVIIPDKLPPSKLILELESNDAIAGTTDLSGDSGVIGRILVRKIATENGNGTRECMELDLKGSIYNMTPVQYPGTIMILNFTGSEAKVESLTDTFIQLREDKRFSNDEYAEKLKQWLEDDDNDEYQVQKRQARSHDPSPKNPTAPKRQPKKKQMNSAGVRKKTGGGSRKSGTNAGKGKKK